MPKVSVIIPVYGVEKYIERCARSLFEQTLDDIEYLFIDDCTLDGSIDILKHVLEDYPHRKPQVIIHRMKQNSGQAAVRKWGIQNATGDYVIHCDSDDWVSKDAYSVMYAKAIEDSADCVISGFTITNCSTYNLKCDCDLYLNKTELLKMMLKNRVSWALWNKMVSREIFLRQDFEYPEADLGEDMVLTFQYCIFSKKLSYINKSLYYYYYNDLSITKKRDYKNNKKIYFQLLENTDKLISILKRTDLFVEEIDFIQLKYNVKEILRPYIHMDEVYELWKRTYSDIKLKDMIKCHLSIVNIIVYYLIKFGLYRVMVKALKK